MTLVCVVLRYRLVQGRRNSSALEIELRISCTNPSIHSIPRLTETKMSSFWRNFNHWLHWKLSFWQLPVQPVMKISSKWRHFRFSAADGSPDPFSNLQYRVHSVFQDDVMPWTHFPHYWVFMGGIHWSPVVSHHKNLPVMRRFDYFIEGHRKNLLNK